MSFVPGSLYDFPPFRLDPAERVLLRDGKAVPLAPKALSVLLVLVEHHGHIVDKEDLLKRVWPDTFVEEGNLAFNISVLRKTLRLSPSCESYIETVPRRGYRFTGPVEVVLPQHPTAVVSKSPAHARFADHRKRWILAGIMIIVLAAVAAVFALRQRRHQPQPTSRAMLAVLPVANLTGDPALDYVSDGLTEEIISQLGTLNPNRLGVIARTSSMAYKNTRKTVAQIGAELQVDYVLECSLRQWGDRVRISVQLISIRDQTHVWAENYQSDQGDILKMQNDVARAIAAEIRFTLTPEQRTLAATTHPVDPQVHELCLLGRYEWNKRTDAGLKKALEYFKKAVARDRGYAPAYAGLAETYVVLRYYSQASSKNAFPEAKAAAEQALQLDETLAEAHTVLGLIECTYLNIGAGRREYDRALQLNPNYATAHHWYSFCLWMMGKHEEALGELATARQLDPVSLIVYADEALMLVADHQTDRAIVLLAKATELDPNFAEAHRALAVAYAQKSEMPQALTEARRAAELDPNNQVLATLGYVYGVAGNRTAANRILAQLTNSARNPTPPLVYLSYVYVGLGEKNKALSCLERAYQENSLLNSINSAQVMFDPLRSDPRFQDLLRRNNVISR